MQRIGNDGIDIIGGEGFPDLHQPNAVAPTSGTGSFTDAISKAIGSVDKLQTDSDAQAAQVAGGGGNLHETALALEKADISMRVMSKVRTKIVDAYQEIMKMGV
jgi:flagellar hook-basal body complex protein FliE